MHHFEILVEEESAEALLRQILPAVLLDRATFDLYRFRGKPDLLRKLPDRLRGYRHYLQDDWTIVVLVDRDDDDCDDLKQQLELAAIEAGFGTKSRPRTDGRVEVLNRIAIEELEAWIFGDVEALVSAYPRLPNTLGDKAAYRKPDEIKGGTWEALERELRKVGYYSTGLPKIEVARTVAERMDPARNRSPSFRTFCAGLETFL